MNGCMGLFWLSLLVRVLIHLCRRYYGINKDQRRALRIERLTDWQNMKTAQASQIAAEWHSKRENASSAGSDTMATPPEL